MTPLNNNRGNNNRRRGRGNRQNGGGGQQLNRIDSRARGNAPQLLEKYRKLAQDAHLNGDRVQAEYYLQFADHYFRVVADTRLRQDEQRARRDERWEGGPEEAEDTGEYVGDADFPSFDQPTYTSRPPREERGRGPRQGADDRFEASEEAPRGNRSGNGDAGESAEAADGDNPFEPAENPFVRDNRGSRGLRPRREREERRPRRDEARSAGDEPAGLDPASLPPAISVARDETDVQDAEAKPRRTRARKKPSADDAGEALETVN